VSDGARDHAIASGNRGSVVMRRRQILVQREIHEAIDR